MTGFPGSVKNAVDMISIPWRRKGIIFSRLSPGDIQASFQHRRDAGTVDIGIDYRRVLVQFGEGVARFTATVDFPTPPFPEVMMINRRRG